MNDIRTWKVVCNIGVIESDKLSKKINVYVKAFTKEDAHYEAKKYLENVGYNFLSVDSVKELSECTFDLTEKQQEMYKTNPHFRNCIELLKRDGDAIAMIEQLCDIISSQNNILTGIATRTSNLLQPSSESKM